MKSLLHILLHVARGILKDAELTYPEYRVDFLRDKERLTRIARTRGLGLFTLDLPELDAMLLAGLESGRLSLEGPLSKRVSKRIQVPVLFRGLWLRIFEHNSCLTDAADPTAVKFLRQLTCLGKRLTQVCNPSRHEDARKDYYEAETKMVPPTLGWDQIHLDPSQARDCIDFCDRMPVYASRQFDFEYHHEDDLRVEPNYELRVLVRRFQQYADIVAGHLGVFDAERFSESIASTSRGYGFRHGPGAVADTRSGKHKYRFTLWPAKLQVMFAYDTCGKTASCTSEQPVNLEVPGKLHAVPKTAKTPRLIAAEPVEHQWCQQLLGDFLVERSKYALGPFFDLKRQDLSGRLVISASLDRRLSTVDLKSASDRLSCWTVERFFRANKSVLDGLHAVRTRWIVDQTSLSQQKNFLRLKKFATQGTGVTFPVQTLIFTVAALASLPANNFADCIARYRDRVRVYGDDIIIPSTGYAKLRVLLQYLGLMVNEKKCYSQGHFRESCGYDYFKGVDVAPVKPKTLRFDGPEARAAWIDFTNNLFEKGFWHAVNAADSIVRKEPFFRNLMVVDRALGVVGRTSFCGSSIDHLRKRWNRNLHRHEVFAWTFRSRCDRKPTNDAPGILQWFTEAPPQDQKWSHGVSGVSKTSDGLRWEAAPVIAGL